MKPLQWSGDPGGIWELRSRPSRENLSPPSLRPLASESPPASHLESPGWVPKEIQIGSCQCVGSPVKSRNKAHGPQPKDSNRDQLGTGGCWESLPRH